MARARVLSFMSTFGGPNRSSTPEKTQSPSQNTTFPPPTSTSVGPSPTPSSIAARDSPGPINHGRQRASSRPMSMIGGYQPPLMEIASDTIPELAPIFTFLNSHSNKLYQEGYFLKLNDLDTQGRPYPDRSWTECFAQLVGTVLSLWDAAHLDAAGQDGEVAPTFINLADASIKMIEQLPTRSQNTQPLANVLSISTAGKNRYLFHFSNVNALTQWTAGIRLAMYEHASLQEAYTGSLIAGKGKNLNNIKAIMNPAKFQTEEWTRVRFGAGTPWRRCWCVIAPPTEKEVAAHRKQVKKKSAYDRSLPPLKGDIKFYDTSKTKKVQPIATIKDAYSAYAIYPQSKPLIEQSTLIKIEGEIMVHSQAESTTEGFIFIMPEVRPAISGFEMMLRFLFPIYDVFNLYGRPTRLAADTLDTRSLMFAMPQDRRYGYLEIFDVATLIHTTGSSTWNEREWKKQMKNLTSQRINRISNGKPESRMGSRHGHRNSLPSRTALRFQDSASMRSTPSLHREQENEFVPKPPIHTGSAPPGDGPFHPPNGHSRHYRSASEHVTPAGSPRRRGDTNAGYGPSRLSHEASRLSIDEEAPPPPPAHGIPIAGQTLYHEPEFSDHRSSSESEHRYLEARGPDVQEQLSPKPPPTPVAEPPAFIHEPGSIPQTRPYHSPELRRANSRMSSTTLSQLAAAGGTNGTAPTQYSGNIAAAGAAAAWGQRDGREGRYSEDQGQRGVIQHTTSGSGMIADSGLTNKGMVLDNDALLAGGQSRSRPGLSQSQSSSQSSINNSGNATLPPQYLNAPCSNKSRSVSPLSQSNLAYETPANHAVDGNFVPGPADSVSVSPASHSQTSLDNQPHPSVSSSSTATTSQQSRSRPKLNTSHSILRKPVGSAHKVPQAQQKGTPVQSPNYTMDEIAFSRVSTMKTTTSTEGGRDSDDESHYDVDSEASPDYASTMNSASTRRLAAAQAANRNTGRTGVLKTVGTSDTDQMPTTGGRPFQLTAPGQGSGVGDFSIDFGPTQLYKPEVKASPASPQVERPSSADRKITQRNPSPGLIPPHGRVRVSPGHVIDAYNRSPNRSNLVTPEPGDSRPSSAESGDRRRSMVWAPGAAVIGGSGNRQSITPEQFVQQRASGNRMNPPYAHNRQQSLGNVNDHMRRTSRTPPLVSRNSSGDWSAHINQSSPARPHSRGASSTMNLAQDYTARLSAREQEHVSRVTGSPLINLATNQKSVSQSGGLVGAIEAREQERKDLKSGTNKMVQQAINQRQQQAHNYQPPQPQPSPQMYMPGQFPPSPSHETGWPDTNPNYPAGQATAHQQWGQTSHTHPQTMYENQRPQSGVYNYGDYQQAGYQQSAQYQQGQWNPQQRPGSEYGHYFGGQGQGGR